MPQNEGRFNTSGPSPVVRLERTAATALGLLLLTSGIAVADDAALLRCRAIAEASARLACYDAILPTATEAKASPPEAKASPPETSPTEKFGLEGPAFRKEPDTIETSIVGRFLGWGPKANIELANGQIWQITDDTTGAYSLNNPKVVIRRGLFGAYFLEIEGANRAPKVRRLR